MFDISMGEVLLTFGIAVALVGKRDLPVVARGAGRMLGRSVGFLQRTKNQVNNATRSAELQKMQAEVNKSIRDLEEIKREVYSAGNFRQAFNPLAGGDMAGAEPQKYGETVSTSAEPASKELVSRSDENVAPSPEAQKQSLQAEQQTGSSLLLDILVEEKRSK